MKINWLKIAGYAGMAIVSIGECLSEVARRKEDKEWITSELERLKKEEKETTVEE